MPTMRAAVQDRYGSPSVLREIMIDRPLPKPGEMLIRIDAASVNGYDVLLRSGALKMIASRKFPKQTGLDFVGSVAETFPGSPFKVSDEVWGVLPLHRLGGVAEYVAIEPKYVSLRPTGLTPTDAAALPVVGTTALAALRDVGSLQASERLLIRGASGGVGSVAVQLGKAMGAYVIGLANASNLSLVRELGADEALDYAEVKPAELGRFDVILDTVGSEIAIWRRLLASGGRMAAIVPDPLHPLRWMAYVSFSRIHGGRRVRYFSAKPETAMLTQLARYVEERVVRPIVSDVYPLVRVADAHRAFEASGRWGKQIISINRS